MNDKFAIPKTEDGLVDAKVIAKNAVSMVPTILMVVIILATSFVSTLFQFHFSLKDVIWSEAIIMIVMRILLQVASKYVAGDTRIRRGMVRDPIAKNKDQFASLSEKLDAKDFFLWVDNYNLQLKKKAYARRMSVKISKKRARLSRLRCRAARHGKTVTRKIAELERIIADAEAAATEEYIDANIEKLPAKIRPLRAIDFLDENDAADSRKIYSINARRDLSERLARGIPVAVFLSLLGAAFGYNYSIGTLNAFSLVFDLLTIGINLYIGAFFTGDGTLAAVNASYVNRQAILRLYFSERSAKTPAEQ